MSEPSTWSTPPGVPVAFPPFNTSPLTSKETCPVERLTRALPLSVLQGVVPRLIPPTASLLETVILPTIVFHRTTVSLSWANATTAPQSTTNSTTNKANIFSCESNPFHLRAGFDLIELSGYGRQSTGGANPRREGSLQFAYNFGGGPCFRAT